MKLVHDIILAKRPKTAHLKTKPQARLSILILSKAYPSVGILNPSLDHEMLTGNRFLLLKSNKEYVLTFIF